MAFDARSFFMRFALAMDVRDETTLSEMIHPDYVGYFPQSGERLRGFDTFMAQIANYPGEQPPTTDVPQARLVGGEDRWAITPNYTVVPLASASTFTVLLRVRYPDGSYWRVVAIIELRDEKIYRSENFFAPEFDPPEWRRQFAEIIPRD
jgi:hypothetical protein